MKRHSKNITKIVGWGLLLVVFYFVGRYVIVNWNTIEHVGAPRPGWIIAATLMGLFSYVIHPYALKTLIESHGHAMSYSRALGLCYLPWLGKYVPGKVWVVVTGLYLFGKVGISQPIAITCIILFTSLNLLAGLLISVLFGVPGMITSVEGLLMVGLAITIVIWALPKILNPTLNEFLRWIGRSEIKTDLTARALYRVLLIMVGSNVTYGCGFSFLVRSFGDVPLDEMLYFVGIMVFSEVSGFLALFAPAGIGVREGVLMAGLTPSIGAGPAIVISAVARVWGTGLEFVMIGMGWVGLRYLGSTKFPNRDSGMKR